MQNSKIVIATHGYFAEGIVSSAKLIIGNVGNIETLCCYVEKNVNYEEKIKNLLESHPYNECDLLVITDLIGGSINNIFMRYIDSFDFHLISGLNLSLLLEIILQPKLNEEKLKEVTEKSKSSIIYCNDLNQDSDMEDF